MLEFRQDGIPLWEKKYCTKIGSVPWQKIVDSKKSMYCHSNVHNWNDSAAEEAFQNAKKRYWARINNLPCDISLPDPDSFIEQIDWNPYIDPEQIKELDKAFFVLPDEEQGDATKNKRTKTSVNDEDAWKPTGTPLSRVLENKEWNQEGYHDDSGNMDNTDNPWECSVTRQNGRLTDNDNPWECSVTPQNGGLTDNSWKGDHAQSWGWNEGRDHDNQCRDWNSGFSQKDKGWGKVGCSSWSQQQSNDWASFSNSWGCKSSQQNVTPVNTGWGNRGANVSGWKQQENTDLSRDLQFKRNNGGCSAWNQSYQRREGSFRHNSGYNSSQFQRDDRETGNYWRRDRSNKRDFAR